MVVIITAAVLITTLLLNELITVEFKNNTLNLHITVSFIILLQALIKRKLCQY